MIHGLDKIARTRANFARFSEVSGNRETGWWSRRDLNSRPQLRLFIAKLPAHLATNSRKIKATMLHRQSLPALSHFFLRKHLSSLLSLRLDDPTDCNKMIFQTLTSGAPNR